MLASGSDRAEGYLTGGREGRAVALADMDVAISHGAFVLSILFKHPRASPTVKNSKVGTQLRVVGKGGG